MTTPEYLSPEEFDEEVDEALAAVGQPVEPEPEAWRITGRGSADWAMRKIAAGEIRAVEATQVADEQIGAILAAAERRIAPIREWLDEERRQVEASRAFFERLLIEWHRELLHEDPEAKTIKLPHGRIEARKLPDEWSIDDEAFVEWAIPNAPDLLRIPDPVPARLVIKESLALTDPDEDGIRHAVVPIEGVELSERPEVPGISVLPGTTKIAVKPSLAP